MAFVQWSKSLSVGIPEIDEQHKHFIGLLNSAKEAYGNGAGKGQVGEVISGLVSYARYHFETEEKYFREFGYPYAQEHEAEHAKLLSRVLVFSNRFENGEKVAPELLSFLKDWLADHLMKHDMKYAKYFKENGKI